MTAALPLLPDSAFAPEHIEALNAVMARTNAEQRQWLSGFLAGYHAATAGAPLPRPPPRRAGFRSRSSMPRSATPRASAPTSRRPRPSRGSPPSCSTWPRSAREIADQRNLLVVASTWGEGDPPERAAEFYKALMAEDAPRFDGVRFAVLALGDSSYVNFCEVGRRIDLRLEALGGERIAPRVECDLDYEARPRPGRAARSRSWRRAEPDPATVVPGGDIIHVDFAAPAPVRSTQEPIRSPPRSPRASISTAAARPSRRSIWSVARGSRAAFEPGDSLGIVPENDPRWSRRCCAPRSRC